MRHLYPRLLFFLRVYYNASNLWAIPLASFTCTWRKGIHIIYLCKIKISTTLKRLQDIQYLSTNKQRKLQNQVVFSIFNMLINNHLQRAYQLMIVSVHYHLNNQIIINGDTNYLISFPACMELTWDVSTKQPHFHWQQALHLMVETGHSTTRPRVRLPPSST